MGVLSRVRRRLLGPPRTSQFLIAPSQLRLFDTMAIEKGTDPALGQHADPTIVSFGTRDGFYDKLARRLGESCAAAGMAADVETIPDCSRETACTFKPTFIKLKLLTRGRTILWLDADAVVSAPFELPGGEWDIATLTNNRDDPVNPKAALCIAFNPTVAALRFLEHWEQLNSAHWLKPGLDHPKLNYTRHILSGHFVEADLTAAVKGKIVRDAGRRKEAAI